jgi:hypothetical protein
MKKGTGAMYYDVAPAENALLNVIIVFTQNNRIPEPLHDVHSESNKLQSMSQNQFLDLIL